MANDRNSVDNGDVLASLAGTSLTMFVPLAMPLLIKDYQHFEYVSLIAATIEQAIDPPRPARQVVSVPPRHAKSFLAVATIAYYLGKYPSREVMLVAHSHSLARDMAAKVRTFMETPLFKAVFPNFRLQPGRESTTDFRTSSGGGFIAGGPDINLTGRGADLLIIDDSVSAQDAQSEAKLESVRNAFDAMLSTRINDIRNGSIILIAHRLAVRDLSGHLLELGYQHLKLPFQAETDESHTVGNFTFTRRAGEYLQRSRVTDDVVAAIKKLPAHVYATQYQQNPTAVSAGLLRERHFPMVDSAPGGGQRIASWDLASSVRQGSSYTAVLLFEVHESVAYLRHLRRGQVDYNDIKSWAADIQERFKPTTHLIEAQSLGRALASDLRTWGANVTEVTPGVGKEERVNAVLHRLEASYVNVVRNTPHLQDFLDECYAFPHGANDDQVDCLSQFLAWTADHRPAEPKVSRLVRMGPGPNSRAGIIQKMYRKNRWR